MKAPAGAVAHELAHDRIAERLGVRLDGMTDISHARAGLDRFDAETVALERRHEKLHRVFAHLAHGDGRGIIPVKALHHERDVDADDSALLQDLLRVGDAVADDVVHRGADALGKAPVVEWCGDDVVFLGEVDLEIVDLLGRHAGNDLLYDPLEALGREPAGPGHGLDLGLTLDEDESARLVEIDAVGVLFHHTVNRKCKRPFCSVLARHRLSMRPAIMSTALYAQPATVYVFERGRRSGRARWRIR